MNLFYKIAIFLSFHGVINSQLIPIPVGVNQVFLSINQRLNGKNQNLTNPLKILTRNEINQLLSFINENKNETRVLYDGSNDGDFLNYIRLLNEVHEEPQTDESDIFHNNQQLDYLKILDMFLLVKEHRLF
jgi:hypothetical protein